MAATAKKYVVAPKCALTTCKGIVAAGDEIDASYFAEKKTFDGWVKAKKIVLATKEADEPTADSGE